MLDVNKLEAASSSSKSKIQDGIQNSGLLVPIATPINQLAIGAMETFNSQPF